MATHILTEMSQNSTGEDLPEERQLKSQKFNSLLTKAKKCTEEDRIYDGYCAYKKAYTINPAEKLLRKLQKMEDYLTSAQLWPKDTELPTKEKSVSPENVETTNENKQNKENINRGPELSDDDKIQFNAYIKQGKQLTESDQIYESYLIFRKAYALNPVDKLTRKLQRMKTYLNENDLWPKEPETLQKSFECSSSVRDGSTTSSTCSPSERLAESVQHTHISSQSPCKDDNKSGVKNDNPPHTSRTSSHSGSDDELEPEIVDKFNSLIAIGKKETKAGNLAEALQAYNDALELIPSEKLEKRIKKIKDFLAEQDVDEQSEEEEVGDDMIHMGEGFSLYKDLYNNIYEHQRQGVLWMWHLYKKRKGGILGDDMGLGKTIQVIAFLSGMFDCDRIKSVLIVLPVAVMVNWEREFTKWAPGITLENFHANTKREKERALQKVARRGGVVLTSYGMLVRPENTRMLSTINGTEFKWDYIILDEGHKIKNPSAKCSKGIHMVLAKNRLILTGTPIQNNLKEMWTLFDWTHQGSLLGTARSFTMQFDAPIQRARQKDATLGEQRIGQEISTLLKQMIAPYFMRRTKAEVSKNEKTKDRRNETNCQDGDKIKRIAPDMPTMTRKNDLVCWVFLSQTQEKIYTDFISLEEIKHLLNTSKSPLTALTQLKKICDHPRLLTLNQCHKLGLDMDEGIDIDEQSEAITSEAATSRIEHIADHVLIEESGKMRFLVGLLDNLKQNGHRCLVFSQSRKVLDIIQKVLTNRGHRVARLDGTIRHLNEREEIIKKFSNNQTYSVFLLTTQVGGVGLTLTAADRVVIFDPSWNPATDAQAVDRAFRIGQDKNVVIYRLITCGSVEEKIYRRQIFKDSITKQTTGESNNPYRYFSRQELYELFTLDNTRYSSTQSQLIELQRGQRNTDTSLDEHIAFLHTLEMFGVSDHDLMFNREAVDIEGEEHENDQANRQNRVATAQRIIALEAQENEQQTAQDGRYKAPEVFAIREPRGMRETPAQQFQPMTDFGGINKYIDDAAMETDMNTSLDRVQINDTHHMRDDSHISITDTPGYHGPQARFESTDAHGKLQTPVGSADRPDLMLEGLSDEQQMNLAMQLSMMPDTAVDTFVITPPGSAVNSPLPKRTRTSDTPSNQTPNMLERLKTSMKNLIGMSPAPNNESVIQTSDEKSKQVEIISPLKNVSPVELFPNGGEVDLTTNSSAMRSPMLASAAQKSAQIMKSPEVSFSDNRGHDGNVSDSSFESIQNDVNSSQFFQDSSANPVADLSTSQSHNDSRLAVSNVRKVALDSDESMESETGKIPRENETGKICVETETVKTGFKHGAKDEVISDNPDDSLQVRDSNETTPSDPDASVQIQTVSVDDKSRTSDVCVDANAATANLNVDVNSGAKQNRRRSVNVGLMPRPPSLNEDTSPPVVVRQELIFSPRPDEPEVSYSPHRASSDTTVGYQTFMDQVESRPNCNSTRIGDVKKLLFDEIEEKENDFEEMDEQEEVSEVSGSEESEEELTDEDIERYRNHVLHSRRCYKAGDFGQAIKLVTQALQLYDGDAQVLAYADKLSKKLKQRQGLV